MGAMGGDYNPATEFELRGELAARRLEAAASRNLPAAKDIERSNAQAIASNHEKQVSAYVSRADGETPMELFAKWREVSAELAEFTWSCVAIAMHGLIPREAIPGHDLHRGLSAAAYGAMLPNAALARELASVLPHSRPGMLGKGTQRIQGNLTHRSDAQACANPDFRCNCPHRSLQDGYWNKLY